MEAYLRGVPDLVKLWNVEKEGMFRTATTGFLTDPAMTWQ
jgi:hypothetical protein